MKLMDQIGEEPGGLRQHLCRYVAGLTWINAPPTRSSRPESDPLNSDARAESASGFLVNVGRFTCWVTAGHVLGNLRKAKAQGRLIVGMQMMYGWHDREAGGAFPFPLEQHPQFELDHDGFGFDIGVVPLGPYSASPLAAAGLQPLSREIWATSRDKFDGYVMLGFPEIARSSTAWPTSKGYGANFGLRTPLIRLERTTRPLEMNEVKHPRFYGRIVEMPTLPDSTERKLDDIEGMSGGPIFGVRKVGTDVEYRLVAVQGSWRPNSGVVAGTPVRPLFEAVAQRMDQLLRTATAKGKWKQGKRHIQNLERRLSRRKGRTR